MIVAMAWRNLWRQPRRTIFSLLAIGFAAAVTIFMLSLQQGVYGTMIVRSLGILDGYAQIQRPGFLDDPELKKVFDDPEALAARVNEVPGVKDTAIRAQGFALLSKGQVSVGAEVVGVQPSAELKVSTLPGMIKRGRYLSPEAPNEIVIGNVLARNLKAGIGDRLTLIGMARDGTIAAASLKVSGFFSTGLDAMDRQLAEIPLDTFRSAFHMGDTAHAIVITAGSLGALHRLVPRMESLVAPRGLVVRQWDKLVPGLKQAIELDATSSSLVYLALLVVVVFTILNTMLMAVMERTREFGLMLSLGMSPGRIGLTVWVETIFLILLGMAFGIGLGFGVTEYFVVHGITFQGSETLFSRWGLPAVVYPAITPLSLLAGPAVISFFVFLMGLYPALRARRLDPVAALRTEA